MGMMSKLKGAKKAADEHKAAQNAPTEVAAAKPRYVHKPTHAARDALAIGWKQDDRENIKKQNVARMSRTNSEFSFISKTQTSSPNMQRSSSGLSMGEWSAYSSPSTSPSLGSSRQSSFQNLPLIQRNDPPVPGIPAQYVAKASSSRKTLAVLDRNSNSYNQQGQLRADHSRPSLSKNYASQCASPLGKSPLVSEGPSSIHSEESFNVSDTSSDVLEIHPDPKYQDSKALALAQLNNHINRGHKTESQVPRQYFGHTRAAQSAEAPATQAPAPKKARFGFMRRSQGAAIAAH